MYLRFQLTTFGYFSGQWDPTFHDNVNHVKKQCKIIFSCTWLFSSSRTPPPNDKGTDSIVFVLRRIKCTSHPCCGVVAVTVFLLSTVCVTQYLSKANTHTLPRWTLPLLITTDKGEYT